MYVEGRVVSVDGKPIPGATIETWETDGNGECACLFDTRRGTEREFDRLI